MTNTTISSSYILPWAMQDNYLVRRSRTWLMIKCVFVLWKKKLRAGSSKWALVPNHLISCAWYKVVRNWNPASISLFSSFSQSTSITPLLQKSCNHLQPNLFFSLAGCTLDLLGLPSFRDNYISTCNHHVTHGIVCLRAIARRMRIC